MITGSRASATVLAAACALAFSATPRSAAAHNTTGVCWEDFSKNDFALRWDAYTQGGGAGFMGWSHILTNGQLVQCDVGGDYYANVAASCWSWRHLCGNAYINVGADFHIHVADYLGRLGPAVSRGPVQAHTVGYKLHVYMEHPGSGPGAPPELVDLDYIQIKTASAILSVKDASGVWWDSPVYTPNSADYYYDVSSFAWEITEATITAPPGGVTEPQLGGIYIATP